MAQGKGRVPVETVARARRRRTRQLRLARLRRLRWRTGRLHGLARLGRPCHPTPLSPRASWPKGGRFSGAQVSAAEAAVLALPINLVRIVWIDRTLETIPAADGDPVLVD